jgi:hypothetical protein
MNSGLSYTANPTTDSTGAKKTSNGLTKDSRREFVESTGDYKL